MALSDERDKDTRRNVTVTPSDEVDKDTLRNYIDKLDRAYASAAATSSRLGVAQLVVSVVLGTVSVGVVSVEQNVTISGLEFSMPLSTLLLGGVVLSFAISMAYWAMQRRETYLQAEIMFQYRRAGLEIDTPPGSDRSPWGTAGPLDATLGGSESGEPHGLRLVALSAPWQSRSGSGYYQSRRRARHALRSATRSAEDRRGSSSSSR